MQSGTSAAETSKFFSLLEKLTLSHNITKLTYFLKLAETLYSPAQFICAGSAAVVWVASLLQIDLTGMMMVSDIATSL